MQTRIKIKSQTKSQKPTSSLSSDRLHKLLIQYFCEGFENDLQMNASTKVVNGANNKSHIVNPKL